MKKLLLVSVITILSTHTFAQSAPAKAAAPIPAPTSQQTNSNFLNHAVIILQTQRNNALDAETVAESRLAQANDLIRQLELKVKGLEDKLKIKPEDRGKK